MAPLVASDVVARRDGALPGGRASPRPARTHHVARQASQPRRARVSRHSGRSPRCRAELLERRHRMAGGERGSRSSRASRRRRRRRWRSSCSDSGRVRTARSARTSTSAPTTALPRSSGCVSRARSWWTTRVGGRCCETRRDRDVVALRRAVAVAVDDPPFAVLPTEDVRGAQRVRRPPTARSVHGLVLERDGVGEVAARPGRDQLILLVHQPGEVAGHPALDTSHLLGAARRSGGAEQADRVPG